MNKFTIDEALQEFEKYGAINETSDKVPKVKSTLKKQESAKNFSEPDGVVMYTDGSVRKTGIGGMALVVVKDHEVIYKTGCRVENTTNNQMELGGVLYAFQYMNHYNVKEATIYSDSEYACNSLNIWIYNWMRNGWKSSTGSDVKNKDLILRIKKEIDTIKATGKKYTLSWISGHHGTEGNEIADTIATDYSS